MKYPSQRRRITALSKRFTKQDIANRLSISASQLRRYETGKIKNPNKKVLSEIDSLWKESKNINAAKTVKQKHANLEKINEIIFEGERYTLGERIGVFAYITTKVFEIAGNTSYYYAAMKIPKRKELQIAVDGMVTKHGCSIFSFIMTGATKTAFNRQADSKHDARRYNKGDELHASSNMAFADEFVDLEYPKIQYFLAKYYLSYVFSFILIGRVYDETM